MTRLESGSCVTGRVLERAGEVFRLFDPLAVRAQRACHRGVIGMAWRGADHAAETWFR